MSTVGDEIKLDREMELPQLRDRVYLDNAGAGLPLKSHLTNYTDDLMSRMYSNPHSQHTVSHLTRKVMNNVRDEIAQFLNTDLTQYSVIFTSGTTGSCKQLVDTFNWGRGEGEQGGSHVYLNSELFEYQKTSKKIQDAILKKQSCFLYLESNHTSVVGMREIAQDRGVLSVCVREEDMFGSVPSYDVTNPMIQSDNVSNESDNILQIFTHPNSGETANETFQRLSSERIARHQHLQTQGFHLLAYPATCNFSGRRYPIGTIEQLTRSGYKLCDVTFAPESVKVFIDAAAALSTSEIDLSRDTPHFLAFSFYKLFGFPTGIGALLVRNDSCYLLNKKYFGGGTVWSYVSRYNFHLCKETQKFFEDGTISYQSILALHHGFKTLKSLGLYMCGISSHTFSLTEYTYSKLSSLRHFNNSPICEIYTSSTELHPATQGPILTFNVLRSDGSYVGYSTLNALANASMISIRVGCFCNVGACQKYLKLSDDQMLLFLKAGHRCGDEIDLVEGLPTGAVRVSFGYYNTKADADRLIDMLERNFVETQASKPAAESTEFVTNKESIYVKEIALFPIKSCGSMKVKEWPVCEKGFLYDRVWAIRDSKNVIIRQTMDKNLYNIRPFIDLESGIMQISYPGMKQICFKINDNKEHTNLYKIRVYGVRLQAVSPHAEVNEWLSQALGYKVELAQMLSSRYATDKPKHVEVDKIPLQMQSKAHVLLISQQSADNVLERTQRFTSTYKESVVEFIDRMRGNLLVEGKDLEPFVEHTWRRISVKDVAMDLVCDCMRCEVISIHADNLSINDGPMRLINKEKNGLFGIQMSFDIQPGKQLPTIAVGDKLIVLTTTT
ncbi:hypothetical protein LOD99_5125 [Oopsacas minuta]|uniref:MOSC domain-containing protein n=1 Tax=Oopsacas minuta TaxID=111878 RepID=A0AAV7JRW2_9METZ|nr:hypothetical protein LOD99_5125 [Oopsacas minuta]